MSFQPLKHFGIDTTVEPSDQFEMEYVSNFMIVKHTKLESGTVIKRYIFSGNFSEIKLFDIYAFSNPQRELLIKKLHACGQSQVQIVRILGLPTNTVSSVLRYAK